MSNIKQQIADTREYAKLLSESLIQVNEQLATTDNQIGKLGQTTLQTSVAITNVSNDTTANNELLKELNEAQESTHSQMTDMVENFETLDKSVRENTESVNVVAESVLNAHETITANHVEIIEKFTENNKDYSEGVEELSHKIEDISSAVNNVNYVENFENVQNQISEANEKLIEVNTENEKHYEDLLARISNVVEQVTEATQTMVSLGEQTDEIQSDVKTMIARTGSIEVKLDALKTENETGTTQYKKSFDSELETLKGFMTSEDSNEEIVESSDIDEEPIEITFKNVETKEITE